MQRAAQRDFARGNGSSLRRWRCRWCCWWRAACSLRSLVKLVTMDIGFDKNNVLLVYADLHTAKVTSEQQPAMFEDIENGLR